jgi:nitronate monooxygenase
MSTISSRRTRALKIRHPILSSPMALAAGGALAAAVSERGGLGLIGGSNGDSTWLDEQFARTGRRRWTATHKTSTVWPNI